MTRRALDRERLEHVGQAVPGPVHHGFDALPDLLVVGGRGVVALELDSLAEVVTRSRSPAASRPSERRPRLWLPRWSVNLVLGGPEVGLEQDG